MGNASMDRGPCFSTLEDLESRSRRQNCFVGIEDTKGSPLLDTAHRSLAPKPKLGPPLCPMIVKVHHFQAKQQALRLAREKALLSFRGHPVCSAISPSHYPPLLECRGEGRTGCCWHACQLLSALQLLKCWIMPGCGRASVVFNNSVSSF